MATRQRTAAASSTDKKVFQEIASLVDAFCNSHLDADYAELCRDLTEVLAGLRPSPLLRGKPQTWACGIVRTIGWVNFLDDKTQTPHMKMTDIDKAFGVSESSGQAKSSQIRKMFRMGPMEPAWCLPSLLEENPLVWMIEVNGFLVDVRHMPREFQEEALRLGLIPFIPEKSPALEAEDDSAHKSEQDSDDENDDDEKYPLFK